MSTSALVDGAIDVHVHVAPSLFPRWGDAGQLAKCCSEAGMAGFVLKAHHGSTVELAAVVQERFPELHVLGGITLNHFVGGLNPHAVDAAMALGGRVVWLPTVHATEHAIACGQSGEFTFQRSGARLAPPGGIRLTGNDGELLPEVHAILDVLDGTGVVLASGHASATEVAALHKQIRARGIDLDLLVNHVRFLTPALELDALDALAHERTWFEMCFFSTCALVQATTVAQDAKLLSERPALNWILASDAGQAKNDPPPEALSGFVDALVDSSAPREVVRRAVADSPKRMLGIA